MQDQTSTEKGITATTVAASACCEFRIGPWLVEPSLNRLSLDNREVHLEPKAMAVLVDLASRAGTVVSTEELIDRIWGGRPMGDNPVYKCIGQLRKAMGDDAQNPRFIATVPRKGYRLIAPVAAHSSEALQTPPGPRRAIQLAAIATCLMITLATLYLWPDRNRQVTDLDSLALVVLPFEYEGDGQATAASVLAAEVTTYLSELAQLHVIAHESARTTSGIETQEALKRLGVGLGVVGQVRRNGRDLTVRTRLTDLNDRTLWDQHWSGPEVELPELAQHIADQIAAELNPLVGQADPATRVESVSFEALKYYQLAHEHLRSRGPNFKTNAIELFEKALIHDPGFAAAHAGLARAYLVRDDSVEWSKAVSLAELALERALELDDGRAEVHHALGILLMTDRQGPCPPICRRPEGYSDSEQAFRTALQLRPGFADAHNGLAITLTGQGRAADAFAQLQVALRHDPLNPVINYNLALHLSQRGERDAAMKLVQDFLDHHPSPPGYMHGMLAHIERRFGNFRASLDHFKRADTDWPDEIRTLYKAQTYFHLGLHDRIEPAAAGTNILTDARAAHLYIDLLTLGDEQEALEAYTEMLETSAGQQMTEPAHWPGWKLRAAGKSRALLGQHEQAISHLTNALGLHAERLDHQNFVEEIDALHYLAWSLYLTGEHKESARLVDLTLQLIRDRQNQGYDGYPEQTLSLARALALRGDRSLAVATVRQAVAQGWRGYWSFKADPRWSPMRNELDLADLLSRVRDDIEKSHLESEAGLALEFN